jgi:hypothetical protein
MATSSQALARVGDPRDLYYTDEKNCLKQAIPVEVDTRYRQDFSNRSTGVSVFTISPGNGVKHLLICLGYNAGTLSAGQYAQVGDKALERGWGYNAIRQISFRIGGSTQYFLTGSQLLQRNLRLVRTGTQRDSLLSLGGQECKVVADFAVTQFAYIPVSIWCAPGEDELGVPLPTDLLSSQVQITCELNPATSFWSTLGSWAGTGTPAPPPPAFDTAYFQIEQHVMRDRGMGLANRVDLNTHMYSMPLPTFDQQQVSIQLAGDASAGVPNPSVQQPVLTGFRAGEVKKINIWLTRNAVSTEPVGSANAQLWYVPFSIKLLYAGQVYSQFETGSAQMWNLLDGTSPNQVNQSALLAQYNTATPPVPVAWTSAPVLSQWCELPFAAPCGSDYQADILVHGKEILNGIANLEIITPQISAPNGWTMNVVYTYNAVAAFSRGSCELLF